MNSNEPTINKDIVVFVSHSFLTQATQAIIDGFINKITEGGDLVSIYFFNINDEENSCITEWRDNPKYDLKEIKKEFTPPKLTDDSIIVDALFGFELEGPLTGGFSAVVNLINSSSSTVFSLAAPSGLLAKDNTGNSSNIIKADYTLLLQKPPLSFYFNENQAFFGNIIMQDGFDKAYDVPQMTTINQLKDFFKPRKRFSHKGTYGHGLLIAGSSGMAGAATLAGKAAIKSGMGLLSLHTPLCNRSIHQIALPEAILNLDGNEICFSEVILDLEDYNALAIGPGIGLYRDSEVALENLLLERSNLEYPTPLIVDADAINLIANKQDLLKETLKNVILTPHPIEFERLVGHCNNSYIRLQKAIEFSKVTGAYIILKGAYSFLISPDGQYQLNPTGNSGMAKGGSGDVLTGILLSLASQGYSLEECMKLGCYIHGRAGEIAASKNGEIGMSATDIVDAIPLAWMEFCKAINEE